MQSGIYSIQHRETGRVYIGSAVSIHNRLNQHRAELRRNDHGNQRLQNAWNKYGEEDFSFAVLEVVSDKTLLIKREQHWMDVLGAAVKPNFNICPTAGSALGRIPNAATRAKMSKARIGKRLPPWVVAKIAEAHRGMKRSTEARANIGLSLRGKKMHPNTQLAIRASLIGYRHSDETRLKMSKPKPPRSAQHRANLSKAMMGNQNTLGYVTSDATKAKLSIARLNYLGRKTDILVQR